MRPDKIYLSLSLLIILTVVIWITSCTHDARISDIPQVCFVRDVLPVYTNNCAIPGCHDGGGESHMALNNYADISQSVVAGNPNASSSYKAIITTSGEGRMPPNQPLSLENRTIVRLWIEQGAGLTLCGTKGIGEGGGRVTNVIYSEGRVAFVNYSDVVRSQTAVSDNLKHRITATP